MRRSQNIKTVEYVFEGLSFFAGATSFYLAPSLTFIMSKSFTNLLREIRRAMQSRLSSNVCGNAG